MEQVLGGYELRGKRGQGSAGTVYDAYNPRLARRVALKVMPINGQMDWLAQHLLARFRQEARIAANLHHPGVVAVFDYNETPDAAFLAMEFVDGETLKELLDRAGRPSVARIVAIMTEVLRTLDYCHRAGVVHRDIKPSNLMLPRGGGVKITDFGIARTDGTGADGAGTETRIGTQLGTWLGTPAYMSPEQFTARYPVDGRSDIWSCGIVLCELLTGQRPFRGDENTIAYHVVNEPAPVPTDIAPHVPAAFDTVVAHALAKDPKDRYATAEDFADALQAALPVAPTPTPLPEAPSLRGALATKQSRAPAPASAPPTTRRWLPAVALGLLAIAILGAGLFWWQHQEQAKIEAQQQQVAQRTRDEAAAELRRQQIAAEEAKRTQEAAAAEIDRQRVAAEEARRATEAAAVLRRQQIAAEEAKRAKEVAAGITQRMRDQCGTKQDRDVAIAGCTAVILSGEETATSQARALLWRGSHYNAKGQYDRAITDLDQAIRLDPSYAAAYNDRGYAYIGKGQFDRAITDLDQAIRLDPNNAVAYNNRGSAYIGKSQFDRAIIDLDQAIRLNPNYAVTYNNRGHAYRALGQQARSAEDFAKARQLDPSLPAAPQ